MRDDERIDWNEVSRDIYRSSLLSSSDWVKKANDLLATAELVAPMVAAEWQGKHARMKGLTEKWPQDHSATYFMLTAFAVENLLKGALVISRHCEIAEEFDSAPDSKKRLPKILEDHNLLRLLRRICESRVRPLSKPPTFPLSLEEEDLMRRLTINAEWYGRYPIAIGPRGTGEATFSDGKIYSLRWFGEHDVEKLKRLVARIRLEFFGQG
jgi:hypothetical protein